MRQVLRSKFQKAGNQGEDEQEDADREFKDDDDDEEKPKRKGKGKGRGRGRKTDGGDNKPGRGGKKPAESGQETSADSSGHQQAERDKEQKYMDILDIKFLEEKAKEAEQKAEGDVIETQKAKAMTEGDEDQEEAKPPKAPTRKTACKAKPTPKKKKKPVPPSAEPKTPEKKTEEGKGKEGASAKLASPKLASPKLTPRRQRVKRMKRYQDSPLRYTTYKALVLVLCLFFVQKDRRFGDKTVAPT